MALEELGRWQDKEKATRLIEPLFRNDPSILVRYSASSALAKLGTPAAIELLFEAGEGRMPNTTLVENDARLLRQSALEDIGTIGDVATIPRLVAIWRRLDSAANGVSDAFEAFGAAAVDPLLEVVKDPCPSGAPTTCVAHHLRCSVLVVLSRIGDDALRERLRHDWPSLDFCLVPPESSGATDKPGGR